MIYLRYTVPFKKGLPMAEYLGDEVLGNEYLGETLWKKFLHHTAVGKAIDKSTGALVKSGVALTGFIPGVGPLIQGVASPMINTLGKQKWGGSAKPSAPKPPVQQKPATGGLGVLPIVAIGGVVVIGAVMLLKKKG